MTSCHAEISVRETRVASRHNDTQNKAHRVARVAGEVSSWAI